MNWGQNWPRPGATILHWYIYKENSNNFFSWTTNGKSTKRNRNSPWVVPYQNCSNGSDCISRSRGQKIRFQNAIFNNLIVWHYKAQNFHIWYIASSTYPLPKLFKLCHWGQNWPRPGGHNFTYNYIRNISNKFLSFTAYWNLAKLDSNGPSVVLYQFFLTVLIGCISSSQGFFKCNFQNCSCLKQHGPERLYLVYTII